MSDKPNLGLFSHKKTILLINFILISLMMGCFGAVILQSVNVIFDDWYNAWLPVICILIAFEALASQRMAENYSLFSKDWIIHHFVEWVAIFLFLKIISYFFTGFNQLIIDLSSWQTDFSTFFTLDYIILLVTAIAIWIISLILMDPLKQLEEDIDLMDQEKLGITFNDRAKARARLIAVNFIIGILMIIIAILFNSNLVMPSQDAEVMRSFITAIVVYFLFAFVLIAINQYNLMRAHWYLQNIQESPEIGKKWILYSVLILFIVTLLVIFLPTNYALTIFPAFQVIINLLTEIITFLLTLVAAPFIALFKWLSSLFGSQTLNDNLIIEPESAPPLLRQQKHLTCLGGMPSNPFSFGWCSLV